MLTCFPHGYRYLLLEPKSKHNPNDSFQLVQPRDLFMIAIISYYSPSGPAQRSIETGSTIDMLMATSINYRYADMLSSWLPVPPFLPKHQAPPTSTASPNLIHLRRKLSTPSRDESLLVCLRIFKRFEIIPTTVAP